MPIPAAIFSHPWSSFQKYVGPSILFSFPRLWVNLSPQEYYSNLCLHALSPSNLLSWRIQQYFSLATKCMKPADISEGFTVRQRGSKGNFFQCAKPSRSKSCLSLSPLTAMAFLVKPQKPAVFTSPTAMAPKAAPVSPSTPRVCPLSRAPQLLLPLFVFLPP